MPYLFDIAAADARSIECRQSFLYWDGGFDIDRMAVRCQVAQWDDGTPYDDGFSELTIPEREAVRAEREEERARLEEQRLHEYAERQAERGMAKRLEREHAAMLRQQAWLRQEAEKRERRAAAREEFSARVRQTPAALAESIWHASEEEKWAKERARDLVRAARLAQDAGDEDELNRVMTELEGADRDYENARAHLESLARQLPPGVTLGFVIAEMRHRGY